MKTRNPAASWRRCATLATMSSAMTYTQIVQAIAVLEQSGMPIARMFHVLNQWRR